MERWYLILPMLSAFFYAVAAMAQKQAIAAGYGPWRLTALSSWLVPLPFMFLILLEDEMRLPDPIWPPLISGLLFMGGQLFTILAITRGDVSVSTPVLGTKVILVVLFLSWFTDKQMGAAIWLAAFLTCLGVVFIQVDTEIEKRGQIWFTIGASILAAACFAGGDVLVQQGSADQGFYRFMSVSAAGTFAAGFVLLPFLRKPLWDFPAGSGKFVWIGTLLLSLQAMGIAFAVGYFGDAAASNIVYNSRGLWSIVLVWWVGHRFTSSEQEMGPRTLLMRLIGAALILSAIVLIFL
ncbi:MAG: DMT family transporter [Verrucomicrobiota bacterium]